MRLTHRIRTLHTRASARLRQLQTDPRAATYREPEWWR